MDYCKLTPSLELEDKLVCQNYQSLDNAYQGNQEFLNNEFLFVPEYYKCFKDAADDNELFYSKNPRWNRVCDRDVVLYRGQNNVAPQNLSKKKNEFLIPVCDCDTYRNHLICDKHKCCSKTHQTFGNLTKRQGVFNCNSKN